MENKLLEAFNDFTKKEYEHEPIDRLSNPLYIAYTTLGDSEEYECQLCYDLITQRYLYYINDHFVLAYHSSIKDTIQDLQYCGFDDFVRDFFYLIEEVQ